MIESRAAISKHQHLSFLQTWEAPRILRHKSAHPLQDGSWDDNTNPQLVGSPKNHSSRLPQHHTSSCGCHATGQQTPLLSRLTGKRGFRHHTRKKDAILALSCKKRARTWLDPSQFVRESMSGEGRTNNSTALGEALATDLLRQLGFSLLVLATPITMLGSVSPRLIPIHLQAPKTQHRRKRGMLFPQHPSEILLPQNTASRWPSHPTNSPSASTAPRRGWHGCLTALAVKPTQC